MGILGLNDKKQSSDILIWILLLFVIFGFGKYKNLLGASTNLDCSCSSHKRCRGKSCSCSNVNNNSICENGNFFGLGSFNKIFQGNWIFILVIIGILFLCKDSNDTCNDSNDTCNDNCTSSNSFDSDYSDVDENDINSKIDINNNDDSDEEEYTDDDCNDEGNCDEDYSNEDEDYSNEDDDCTDGDGEYSEDQE